MNLLYIGQFYPRKIAGTVAEDTKGKAGFSNHNFEVSLINGFSNAKGVNLRVLSAPQVYSYPHNNRNALIHKEVYIHQGIPTRSIGFINIAGFNMLSKPVALACAIIAELQHFDGDDVDVIVNPHSLALLEGLSIARKFIKKKLNTTLIVPDVPACLVEMDGGNGLKDKLVQALSRYNARIARQFDKYVFLTGAMNDFYRTKPTNFMVMEGLIDPKKIKGIPVEKPADSDKAVILYTGTLRRIFGVMELVEVFEKGNFSNCELWICGSGECAGEIAAKSKDNPAIKFFGLVSAEKALQLQSQATILANPRSASGNYTRYSFPSKTIEYLLAGKLVVMNRLPGIPSEYDDYLIYPRDESMEAWIEALAFALDMSDDERDRRGKANREFILINKTADVQCGRIIDFIKN